MMALFVAAGVNSAYGVEIQGKVEERSEITARLTARRVAAYEGACIGNQPGGPSHGHLRFGVEQTFDYTTGSLDHAGRHVKASFATNLATDADADVFPPAHQNYNPGKKTEARTVYAYDVG